VRVFKRRGAIAGAALAVLASLPGMAASAQSPTAAQSLREQLGNTEFVIVPGLAASPVRQVAGGAATGPGDPEEPRSSACPALIEEALGRAGCMIAFCESGWNAGATGASGEMGWFQVSPRYHADATYDPAGNVAAAVRISRGGTDWSQWSVASVLETGVCPTGVPYPD
jgi:hypothetical protein